MTGIEAHVRARSIERECARLYAELIALAPHIEDSFQLDQIDVFAGHLKRMAEGMRAVAPIDGAMEEALELSIAAVRARRSSRVGGGSDAVPQKTPIRLVSRHEHQRNRSHLGPNPSAGAD
jgi:hypothetical protein